jgi:hypothetical protein
VSRIRAEVEGAGGGYIVHIDPPELTARQQVTVARILDEAIADLRLQGVADPEGLLAVMLTEQLAEERAYQRVAAQRGVLAL